MMRAFLEVAHSLIESREMSEKTDRMVAQAMLEVARECSRRNCHGCPKPIPKGDVALEVNGKRYCKRCFDRITGGAQREG